MKAKLFIISLIIMASGLLVSCDNGLSEADLNSYIAAIKHYYPYSLAETFLFENKSLGQTWEANAYDYSHEGIYPFTSIQICKRELGSKCSGDRSASIIACMIEKDRDENLGYSEISTYLSQEGGHKEVYCLWRVSLLMSDSIFYTGEIRSYCSQEEVLTQLTDVITIPIQYYHKYGESVNDAPKDAYARIVREKGLTEFSIDGQTVWKRDLLR